MDLAAWDMRLLSAERQLGLSDGFKFVYGRWTTLQTGRVAFLSLNPGVAPPGAALRTVSDERGNSYEVEQATTRSPITDQFLRLCVLLGACPGDVMAGVVVPFRSQRWACLSTHQQSTSLALGREFWSEPLTRTDLSLIVVCSDEAASIVVELTSAQLVETISSGWGNVRIRRFATADGRRVVQLPHLSTFKLLSRSSCSAPLREALFK